MLYLFTFFYIFGFKIYSIIDSTILVGILLSIKIIINKELANIFKKKIFSKSTFEIVISFLLLLVTAGVATVGGGEYDFSYMKVLIHLLIVIIIGYELASLFEYKGKASKILNYMIVAFLVQTIFQWICYMFPTFSSYFNYFRSSSMVEKSVHYNGYRGIALSQSGFFALSSSYALTILMYFSKNNTLTKNNFLKYTLFGILVSGTFFAGRTGFVGLLFIPILLYFNNEKKEKIILSKALRKLTVALICIGIFLTGISWMSNNKKFAKVYNFAFELFNNYEEGNGFRSTSTDVLFEMYNIDISAKTIIFGDGKYSSDDGNYYKKTDVGYYRKILYFGVIGLILSILLQYFLFGNKKNKIETWILLALLLILELKGEIIGLNIMINSIATLYSNIHAYGKEREKNGDGYSFNDNV